MALNTLPALPGQATPWTQGFSGFNSYAKATKAPKAPRQKAASGLDGLAPLSFSSFSKQAQQFLQMLTSPQYQLIDKSYRTGLSSGEAATQKLAGALAQYLTPIYDRVQGAYNAEQGAMAGANNAIRSGLDTNTGNQVAGLQHYLQLSGGPSSYGENAQGLAQNVGQSYSVRAAANQGALASHGLADSTFAAGLPGLAALRGTYDFGNLQKQLASEQADSRDKVAASVPGTLAQLFQSYRTGEENKAIARAAYPKTVAQTAYDLSKAGGIQYTVDAHGNPTPVLDKNGNTVPLKPKTKPPGGITPAKNQVNDRTIVSGIQTWAHSQSGLAGLDPHTGERMNVAHAAEMVRNQLISRGWSQSKNQAALHEQVLNILASLGYPILPEWRGKQKKK